MFPPLCPVTFTYSGNGPHHPDHVQPTVNDDKDFRMRSPEVRSDGCSLPGSAPGRKPHCEPSPTASAADAPVPTAHSHLQPTTTTLAGVGPSHLDGRRVPNQTTKEKS